MKVHSLRMILPTLYIAPPLPSGEEQEVKDTLVSKRGVVEADVTSITDPCPSEPVRVMFSKEHSVKVK